MCGLAGFLDRSEREVQESVARQMAMALFSRGPDDSGVWLDATAGLALAHRRLSILDLSRAGHQPMHSVGGRYVIAFNGEIYNHLDLRKKLGELSWRGHADTETLLAAIETWGLEAALKSLTGMFAFALWDRAERSLTLARDRLGEKPLYYGWQGDTFIFGSELKALRNHPAWRGEVDRNVLASFMRYGYVPVPHSIYQGIFKLLPGTWITLKSGARIGALPPPTSYWRALESARAPQRDDLADEAAADELEATLRRAISGQMVADVPLGAFLSGGVDSSTVVALMQAQSSQPIRTFSIGFAESEYDEARHAKAVAAHLGTSHTEFYLSPTDALAVIPKLPDIYDEPFGDSSQIPTHLVAALARRHVTVSLSGDGGDELFGGYNRYITGASLWRRLAPLPRRLRSGIGRLMAVPSPGQWDRFSAWFPVRRTYHALGDKLHKLAGVLDATDEAEFYRRLISQQHGSESIVLGALEGPMWANGEAAMFSGSDVTERMMFHDLVGYLCDDILTKVDRAAMAVSLETRVPLLDHHIVEFAWKLPLRMKIRDGQGKWLLRQVLYRYVPPELIERPKQGFALPLDAWLRGPLRDWAEALLDERRLRNEGYLRPEPIREKWREHLSGRRNWQHWLWNVLMFQAWRERWA